MCGLQVQALEMRWGQRTRRDGRRSQNKTHTKSIKATGRCFTRWRCLRFKVEVMLHSISQSEVMHEVARV